jgi:hypothetical protein
MSLAVKKTRRGVFDKLLSYFKARSKKTEPYLNCLSVTTGFPRFLTAYQAIAFEEEQERGV